MMSMPMSVPMSMPTPNRNPSSCARIAVGSIPFRFCLSLAVALTLCAATVAGATIHSFTVTGVVEVLELPPDYFLDDAEPVSGGETFTLTFDFDDAAPFLSGNGTTLSVYDPAVSNLVLSISNGVSVSASSEGVVAADNGSNHQWSWSLFSGAAGFATNLPDPLFATNDNSGSQETFGLQSIDFFLADPTGTVYTASPPELVLPTASVFSDQFLAIVWESFDSPGAFIRIETTVSSMTSTPVAAAVPGLGLPAIGLLAACAMGAAARGLRARS